MRAVPVANTTARQVEIAGYLLLPPSLARFAHARLHARTQPQLHRLGRVMGRLWCVTIGYAALQCGPTATHNPHRSVPATVPPCSACADGWLMKGNYK